MANDSTPDVVIVAKHPADVTMAQALAEKLNYHYAGVLDQHYPSADSAWHLLVEGERHILVREDGAQLEIDFTRGKSAQRLAQAAKDQSLLRALGFNKLTLAQRQNLHVIDATAGLGQDGWIIANQGCKTTLLEESALLAHLLKHAFDQASATTPFGAKANNIQIVHAHAQRFLSNLSPDTQPDIIYIDPMFPPRKKQAKVKKGMQFLQALLRENDNTDLLQCALSVAKSRVVAKRPTGAEHLIGSEQWHGQLTHVKTDAMRFDIYHTS